MIEAVQNFFVYVFDYSLAHGVNPYILLLIYVLSIPFVYYPAYVFSQVKRCRIEKTNVAKSVTRSIIISLVALLSPYVYVLAFGRGLSVWIVSLVVLAGFVGVTFSLMNIKKRGVFNADKDK